eukprot:CAMPEP_0116844902 /NCGR_PEP_ID=MMETSP0418-20121206/12959_1 /TAXON_ID=1158023 /ORGANISM="Astrosyne radiata, Strain 13vi08-1A" /LENGTH=536 /DNA_ID=CAMNT_0004475933 /DNA_START=1263 /DNA_END=2873 /DNA_ORIENTATION=-
MKLIVSLLGLSTVTVTATATSTTIQKGMSIDVHNYQGLSMGASCRAAAINSLLIGFNSVMNQPGGQTQWQMTDGNLNEISFQLTQDLVFSDDNEKKDVPEGYLGTISAWAILYAETNFDCLFCNPDTNDADLKPPMLFHNAKHHLADAQLHALVEQAMADELKTSPCASFLDITHVEYSYTNRRRYQAGELKALLAAAEESTIWKQQQVVKTMVEGVQVQVYQANEGICNQAIDEALTYAFHKTFDEEDNGALVQEISLLSHRFEDAPQNENVAAVATSSLRPSKNNAASMSTATFKSQMETRIPKQDSKLLASLFGPKDKQHFTGAAARHFLFEKELTKALKLNKKCAAFETVSEVSVFFEEESPDKEAKALEESVTADNLATSSISQTMEIKLINVGDYPDNACFEMVVAALQVSYNLVQSDVVVQDVNLHGTKEQPMPMRSMKSNSKDLDTQANELGTTDWSSTIYHVDTSMTTLCSGCAFPTLDVNTHNQLQQEIMIILSHSACPAFQSLENVVVTYGSGFDRAIEATATSG